MWQITELLLAGLQTLELWAQILSEEEFVFSKISTLRADYCTIEDAK
jgi:hypothetical protein